MYRIAKITYWINSLTCIFIGVLHTITHYSYLKTEKVKNLINHKIVVSGIDSNIWNLWQGMSLMMGYLLIIIGLLHILILIRTEKGEYPPVGGSIIMILMLFGVIYTGHNFFGAWQVSGAIVGITLQSICLVLSIIRK